MHPPNPEQKQQPAQQQQQIKNSFNIFEVIHRPEFSFFFIGVNHTDFSYIVMCYHI